MNSIEDYARAAQHEVSIETFAHILQSMDTWNLGKREYENSDLPEILEDHPLADLLTPEDKTVEQCLEWLRNLEPVNEIFEYIIGYADGSDTHGLTFTLDSEDTILFELY